jgi:hypothetical protein
VMNKIGEGAPITECDANVSAPVTTHGPGPTAEFFNLLRD